MIVRKDKLRIAVGLSGGVDSSVAASLLKEAGYYVVGMTMKIFDDSVPVKEPERHGCFGPGEKEDIEKAASVCEKLRIPFHIIDLRNEYRAHVINYFRTEYLSGRTPNPCIVCNHRLKFGLLPAKAKEKGINFDLFSTGHYAQIVKSKGRFLLKKAVDLSKDQTYFLYALTPEQLAQTLFPLGTYTKMQVREIASSQGLETAHRPESQDFIANGDYSPLFKLEESKEGSIVDEKGNILGTHRGIIHYTVGQRRGTGISSNRRLYVTKIDAENNRIVVGDRENLFSEGLMVKDLNLMAGEILDRPYRVKVKIRLKHREADATVFPHEHNMARIKFDEPQMSITPGQSVVFYLEDTVFGGGIIDRAL
jgi:tRNA-specific 2-thiouridylase